MSDLGLIMGAALAGGVAGAGGAAKDALAENQQFMQKGDLLKMQEELDMAKQMRIQEAQQNFQTNLQQQGFTHDENMQGQRLTFEGEQGDLNRSNQKDIAGMQTQAEIKAAGIHAGATVQAAQIGADASMHNAALMATSRTIQTLGDGRIVSIGIDPTTNTQVVRPLMDPSDPTKPLMGPKNLDQQHLLVAENLAKQGAAYAAQGMHDQASTLYQQANDILTGKMTFDQLNKGTPMQAPDAAVDLLAKSPTPQNAAFFDQKYGVGASAKALAARGISMAAVTQPTGTQPTAGAAPMPDGSGASGYPASAQQVNKPPLPPAMQQPSTPPAGATDWSGLNQGLVTGANSALVPPTSNLNYQ